MHPFKKMIFQSFSTTTPIEGGGGGALPITVAGLRGIGYATTRDQYM
jgi:hypothetical protein